MLDRIGWGEATWAEIREAVGREAEQLAVCRRLLQARQVSSDTTNFSSGDWSPGDGRVGQEQTLAIVEARADLKLTDQQVRAENLNGDALSMARGYAHLLALTEDLVILSGKDAESTQQWRRISDLGLSITGLTDKTEGFYHLSAQHDVLEVQPFDHDPPDEQRSIYGTNTVDRVRDAIAALVGEGFFGPFALLVDPKVHADLRTRIDPSRIVPLDILPPDVTIVESSRALAPRTGLVVALGGNPMYLLRPHEVFSLEFLNVDGKGLFNFRLFHRFAFRALRADSVVKLEFRGKPEPTP